MSNQLAAIIEALKHVKQKAVPWVDGGQLPWDDPQFSHRFAAKVDYTALFGHPNTILQVDQLQQELELQAGAVVIDLCCGPGPHSIELVRRGFNVLGIDIGSGAIEIARGRSEVCTERPTFIVGDVCSSATWSTAMSALNRRCVTAAFMIRGQIDNFKPSALSQLVGHLSKAIVPGGRLLLEFTEPEAADHASSRNWSVWSTENNIWADRDCLVLSDRHWDPKQQAVIERYWVLQPDGALDDYATCQQCYDRGYMAHVLQQEGWTGIRFTSGDSSSTRVVAVR